MESSGGKTIRQGGFTMVELVIVLFLLTVVGLIAVPSFQRMALNGYLKSVTRDLASDISNLRQASMAENRMYRISLDIPDNSYTLQQCNAWGSVCVGYTTIRMRNLATSSRDIYFEPEGTTVAEFYIQPRGLVTSGAVAISNCRGSMATINVNASGRPNVQFSLH